MPKFHYSDLVWFSAGLRLFSAQNLVSELVAEEVVVMEFGQYQPSQSFVSKSQHSNN